MTCELGQTRGSGRKHRRTRKDKHGSQHFKRYYGNSNKRHEFGTGFVLQQNMVNAVIDFKPVIYYIQFNETHYTISMTSILYQDFHNQIERLLDIMLKQDTILSFKRL